MHFNFLLAWFETIFPNFNNLKNFITFTADAEMPITVDGEFIQHDGKEYFDVKKVDSDLHLSNVKSDISIDGNWFQKLKESFWTGPATTILNLEWKLIKGEMENDKEKFNVIIMEIFKQILDKVAIQDIFHD